jgi:SAM-dependent methyltransferase
MRTQTTLYDSIGVGYARRRRPDPTIAAALRSALGDARRIVNVGAGAGSYEPLDITAAAVEPSAAQRPPALVPAVLAVAERLPFIDGAFDGALAVLTIHHWHDLRRGLQELRRVTDGPIVILRPTPMSRPRGGSRSIIRSSSPSSPLRSRARPSWRTSSVASTSASYR